MSPDFVERLGQLVDKIDNFLTYEKVGPDNLARKALVSGLRDLREEVLQIYFQMGGEDVWS
jgi:hypothetical protein